MKCSMHLDSLIESVTLPDGVRFHDFGSDPVSPPKVTDAQYGTKYFVRVEKESSGIFSEIELSSLEISVADFASEVDAAIEHMVQD
jgi:hypothetical protein